MSLSCALSVCDFKSTHVFAICLFEANYERILVLMSHNMGRFKHQDITESD